MLASQAQSMLAPAVSIRRVGPTVELRCPQCNSESSLGIMGFESLTDALNAFLTKGNAKTYRAAMCVRIPSPPDSCTPSNLCR